MTLYFTYLSPNGRQWIESVTVPPGADPDIWIPLWCSDRLEGGCRQIQPISPRRYRELLGSAKG